MFLEKFVNEKLILDLEDILQNEKSVNNGFLEGVATKNGFQTNSVHEKVEYQNILKNILLVGSPELPECYYRWFHLIDYKKGGWQEEHDHVKTEDYSFIVYLTTCSNGGKTCFRISDSSVFQSTPVRGKILFFPAHLRHWGEEVIDEKRVAVGALKFK